MFGFFKKKREINAMTALSKAMHGPKHKLANLEEATNHAFQRLLNEDVPFQEVAKLAEDLRDGGMPYSTEDLALATALNFFRRNELKPHLQRAQLQARMQMLQWLQDGRVNPLLAQAFENALYERYKV